MSVSPSDVRCPFPLRVNPLFEDARAELLDWIDRHGLVRGGAALARFKRADFAWFAAAVHPTADQPRLALMAQWFAWLFLVDDQLDDGAFGKDLARTRRMRENMRAVLNTSPAGRGPAVVFDNAALLALADLWSRTGSGASRAWRCRFADHLDTCLDTAATWEARNRVDNVVPDRDTYVQKRRHTGAIYVCMDLIEIVERTEVPPDLYFSPLFSETLDSACDVVCWTNDVYSLEKELSLGEVHNLVYIVSHHAATSLAAARAQVCGAVEDELARYQEREAQLVASCPEHLDVIKTVTAGMRSWMIGNREWSRRTHRYTSDDKPDRPAQYLEPSLLEGSS